MNPATSTTFGVCIVKSKINLTTWAGGGLLFRNFKWFKKSEWKNNVPDAELISEKKLIGYGVADVSKEWTKN